MRLSISSFRLKLSGIRCGLDSFSCFFGGLLQVFEPLS